MRISTVSLAHRLGARTRNLAAALLVGGALALSSAAEAASGQCALEGCDARPDAFEARGFERQSARLLAELAREDRIRSAELSEQEYFSFSGIGAVVCTIDGQRRTATASLVGAFDVGVTVAHPFVADGVWARPEDCVYTTTDSLGQIRERIPVASIKTQWSEEADAFGEVAKNFAVIRLAQPSKFARRTLPLGKFSGHASSVLMIGFSQNIDTDTLKLKAKGHVYARSADLLGVPNRTGFIHDMYARGIADGAPVIDEDTGIIIGIHTQGRTPAGQPRNTMIAMNEWLEATLRAELKLESAAKVN